MLTQVLSFQWYLFRLSSHANGGSWVRISVIRVKGFWSGREDGKEIFPALRNEFAGFGMDRELQCEGVIINSILEFGEPVNEVLGSYNVLEDLEHSKASETLDMILKGAGGSSFLQYAGNRPRWPCPNGSLESAGSKVPNGSCGLFQTLNTVPKWILWFVSDPYTVPVLSCPNHLMGKALHFQPQ